MKKIILLLTAVLGLGGIAYAFPKAPKLASRQLAGARQMNCVKLDGKQLEDLRLAMRRADAESTDPEIIDTIKGEQIPVSIEGSASFDYYDQVYVQKYSDKATHIIIEEDGTVYWKDPVSVLPTGSYIKGKITGDKMRFDFPQLVYSDWEINESGVNTNYKYYVMRLKAEGMNDDLIYVPDMDNNYVEFEKDGDDWIMEFSDSDWIMGLTDPQGGWTGYSDWDLIMTPFTEKVHRIPEGAGTERWALTQGSEGRWVTMYINDADNEVMVEGYFRGLPYGVVKGEIKGNEVVFPSQQYLGVYNGYHTYFMVGEEKESSVIGPDDEDGLYIEWQPSRTFTYDKENKILQTEGLTLMNSGKEYEGEFERSFNTRIKAQGQISTYVPKDPICVRIGEWDPEGEWAMFFFNIPPVNVEGDLLDPQNLYYRIYMDCMPYQLVASKIPSYWHEPYDVLQYYFTDDFDVWVDDVQHAVTLYTNDYNEIGVQSIYRDADGKEYLSQVSNMSGVENIVSDKEVASEEWYDLAGLRVAKPENGLYLHRLTYVDGTVKTVKVVVR